MKKSEIFFGALRLPIDMVATFAAFMLAYRLRPITDLIPGVQFEFFPESLPPLAEYTELAVYSSIFLVVIFAVNQLYSLKITHSFVQELFKIVFSVTVWLLFIIAYHFLVIHELFFSRIAMAQIWLFAIMLITLGRILIIWIQELLLRFNIGKRRVLFVGISPIADQFYSILKDIPSYNVIGAVDDHKESRKSGKLKIIDTLNNLDAVVRKYRVEEIIQADPNLEQQDASELLNYCRANQISYHFIPDLMRLQRTNVEVSMFNDMPLVSLRQTRLDGWGHIFKRTFDFIFSLIVIILLIPIWIIIALAIKLDSKGPIIYKSRRQYRDKTFSAYKFRSMVPDADAKKAALMKDSDRKGPLFKIKKDPRVTSVGKFLRKTSLDELPQLFNVLIGNMSLVGPRPHLPEEVAKYSTHHYQVFALKPGMSGLAQVSGRSHLDFEDEVKLDVYYIENWSPWLDIKIILKSVGVIFRADGH